MLFQLSIPSEGVLHDRLLLPDLPDISLSRLWRVLSRSKPVSILEREAASAIWARFDETYLSDDRKRRDYASFAEGKNAVADRCVNRVVFRKCSGKSTFAEGNKDRACDSCVNARRLCARPLDGHGNEHSLGFYPLPDTDRTVKHMRELDHWVIDG